MAAELDAALFIAAREQPITSHAAIPGPGYFIVEPGTLAMRPDKLQDDFRADQTNAGFGGDVLDFCWLDQMNARSPVAIDDFNCKTMQDGIFGGGIRASVGVFISDGILIPSVHTSAHEG